VNALFKKYLQLFNLLHALAGLLITGYGVYLMVHEKDSSLISKVVAITGAVVFFVGALGWYAASRKSSCLLKLYTILMLVLCLGQTALVLALVIKPDKVLGIDVVKGEDVDTAKKWIKDHLKLFIIVEAALAGVEFFLVAAACCFRTERPLKFGESINEPLVTDDEFNWDTKPVEKTDKQKRRDELRAKYGLRA